MIQFINCIAHTQSYSLNQAIHRDAEMVIDVAS